MLTLEQIRERLKDRRLTVVSEATEISHQTLWRIRDEGGNPTQKTIEKLSNYLEETCKL